MDHYAVVETVGLPLSEYGSVLHLPSGLQLKLALCGGPCAPGRRLARAMG